MPKYYQYQIAGYYLYYTSHCIIECMHVHASNKKLTDGGSNNGLKSATKHLERSKKPPYIMFLWEVKHYICASGYYRIRGFYFHIIVIAIASTKIRIWDSQIEINTI